MGQEWRNTDRSLGSRRSTETNGQEVPFADFATRRALAVAIASAGSEASSTDHLECELLRLLDRHGGGPGSAQNFVQDGRKLAKAEREVLTVAHESAFFSHLRKLINRRDLRLRQPRYNRSEASTLTASTCSLSIADSAALRAV